MILDRSHEVYFNQLLKLDRKYVPSYYHDDEVTDKNYLDRTL